MTLTLERLLADVDAQSLSVRLEAGIDRTGGPDACHEWTRHRNEHGYGIIKVGGRKASPTRVHRLVYALSRPPAEPLPPAVRHTCDNPPCANLEHLRPGTQGDNNRDRDQRDRVRHGVTHPNARLTEAQVHAIRHADAAGQSRRSLAREYGVTEATIRKIAQRLTWRRLSDEEPSR